MKNLNCACGNTIRVNDDTDIVRCYNCITRQQNIMADSHVERKTETNQEIKQKQKQEVKKVSIEVLSKDDDVAKVLIDGEQFTVENRLGVDDKKHWIIEGSNLKRGHKINLARKINAFNG